MILIATGDLAGLADTTTTLLLIAFVGVNAAVLAARRDPVEGNHFVVPTWVPIVGIVVCIGLLTQREADVWLRSGALLLLGLALWGVNLLVTRREDRGDPAAAASA
jgi:APA family basic amino acid/polyamine antiporter